MSGLFPSSAPLDFVFKCSGVSCYFSLIAVGQAMLLLVRHFFYFSFINARCKAIQPKHLIKSRLINLLSITLTKLNQSTRTLTNLLALSLIILHFHNFCTLINLKENIYIGNLQLITTVISLSCFSSKTLSVPKHYCNWQSL
jgi:hypothetical protein